MKNQGGIQPQSKQQYVRHQRIYPSLPTQSLPAIQLQIGQDGQLHAVIILVGELRIVIQLTIPMPAPT